VVKTIWLGYLVSGIMWLKLGPTVYGLATGFRYNNIVSSFNHISPLIFLGCTRKIDQTHGFS